MGGLLSSLLIATQALDVDQGAMDVTANNIANVNTPNYSREVPDFAEQTPVEVGNLTFGTGVTLEQIQSVRDQVLTLQIAEQTAQQNGAQTELNALQQIQALFANSNQGIGADITAFFNSISQLSTDPTNAASREAVVTAAQNLAVAFNQTSQSLTSNQLSLNQSVSQTVDQINTLTAQIAQINVQIGQMQQLGQDPGGLEDQENQLISQLSQLTSVSETETPQGLTLTTGNGTPLVVANQSYALTVQDNPTDGMEDVFSQGQDITTTIQGGILGGTIQARDQDIPTLLSALNSLASNFATNINNAQAQGYNLNGTKGQALFSVTGPGAAATFSLATTDPNAIAASSDGTPGSDGNVANLMAVQSQPLTPGGDTPTDAYAALVSQSGTLAAEAQAEVTASTTSINQLNDQLGSISGVSINEETTNLLNYQNAFSAAAHVVSTIDELTQTVLNMGASSASGS